MTTPIEPQPKVNDGVFRLIRVPNPFGRSAVAGTPAEGVVDQPDDMQWWGEDAAGNLVGRWFPEVEPAAGVDALEWSREQNAWVVA